MNPTPLLSLELNCFPLKPPYSLPTLCGLGELFIFLTKDIKGTVPGLTKLISILQNVTPFFSDSTNGRSSSPPENSCRFLNNSSNNENNFKGMMHVVKLLPGSKEEPPGLPSDQIRLQVDEQSQAHACDVLSQMQDRSRDTPPGQERRCRRRCSFPPDPPKKQEHPLVEHSSSQPARGKRNLQLGNGAQKIGNANP